MTESEKSKNSTLMQRVADGALPPDALFALTLDMWQRTRMDWRFVQDGLGAHLRKQGRLGPEERYVVTELLYGLVRHLRRIDTALAAGGLKLRAAAPPSPRHRLVAYLVLESELALERARELVSEVDWAQARAVDERIARESSAAHRIALGASLPDWLAEGLVADHGDRAEAIARALNQRAPTTLRANTLVTSRDDLSTWLGESGVSTHPTGYANDGLEVDSDSPSRARLFSTPAFKSGGFEVQDEASQLVAELVAPPARSIVVDYCAGAGGKTLALAALLGNRGRVVASDIDSRKLTELRRRARRAGVSNAQTIALDPGGGWPAAMAKLEGKVARVLVDAPCSAIGTLRRHPELRWRLSAAEAKAYPARQRALCELALSLLAPGGQLVYATCTLLAAENQGVVDTLCRAHPDLAVAPVAELARAGAIGEPDRWAHLVDDSGRYLAVDPARAATPPSAAKGRDAAADAALATRSDRERLGMDGFFAAVLRRAA